LMKSMKTANIEREIEGTGNILEFGHIPNAQVCLYARLFYLFPCNADGARREINTSDLPARARQCDDVCAGATAEVNGSAGRVGSDEFVQFRRGDATVPGRFAEIPEVEGQVAEHKALANDQPAMSFSNEEGCHFDNSFEFFYNHAAGLLSYCKGRAFR
jgi:hypothetical protein